MELNPDQYANIMSGLATLVAGQEGTNEHLRILNGKVATQEGKINALMLWRANIEGFTGAISVGWGLIISLVSGCAATLAYWLFHR